MQLLLEHARGQSGRHVVERGRVPLRRAVLVDDLRADDVTRKIVEVARTGRMGDGKIFILPAQPYEAVVDLATCSSS